MISLEKIVTEEQAFGIVGRLTAGGRNVTNRLI